MSPRVAVHNLASIFEHHAKARPRDQAICAGATAVDYAEIAAKIRRLGAALGNLGAQEGDRVAVALRDTPDHLVLNYAIARIGAVLVPLDWRWSTDEQARIIEQFQVTILVREDDLADPGAPSSVTVSDLIGLAPPGASSPLVERPDLPLLISLSSGTTGLPSGPIVTHGQMLRRFWTHWINLGLNADDRFLSATPLYFGGGRTFAMSVLFAGGTVVLFPPPFQADALCEAVASTGATSLFLVPTQLRGLLALDNARLAPILNLDLLISSGAPLEPDERDEITQRLNSNFREYYASTEGGGISLSTRQSRKKNRNAVGRAVFGVEISVVDTDDTPLPPGEVGRLRYRGPGVATEAATGERRESLTSNEGWFYPGDLAEIDADGFIILRGRAKDMIIRGGVNIYPNEIETVLRGHPAITDVAVIGLPSKKLGERVAAACISRGTPPETDTLEHWCAERLAPYKVPEVFAFLDDFPRNSTGKVLKNSLVQRFSDGGGRDT